LANDTDLSYKQSDWLPWVSQAITLRAKTEAQGAIINKGLDFTVNRTNLINKINYNISKFSNMHMKKVVLTDVRCSAYMSEAVADVISSIGSNTQPDPYSCVFLLYSVHLALSSDVSIICPNMFFVQHICKIFQTRYIIEESIIYIYIYI